MDSFHNFFLQKFREIKAFIDIFTVCCFHELFSKGSNFLSFLHCDSLISRNFLGNIGGSSVEVTEEEDADDLDYLDDIETKTESVGDEFDPPLLVVTGEKKTIRRPKKSAKPQVSKNATPAKHSRSKSKQFFCKK